MFTLREHSDVYRARPARVSWKVPTFCNNDWIALKLLEYCRQMNVDRPFDIAYGAPLCAWAGGRPSLVRERLSRNQVESYFDAYEEYGVRIALTLSKLKVDTADLKDDYCNMLLDVARRHNAQAIIVDENVLNHVRKHYPEIQTIASLDKVMCELKNDFSREGTYYHEILERFDEVVIRCECALDNTLLESLADVADRIEIITNHMCMPNCQYCDKHIASMEQLNNPHAPNKAPHHCFYERDAKNIETWLASNLTIPESRICELAERGFTKMKLAGRNAPQPKLLDTLARYVFEPTGVIWNIQNALAREYREECARIGGPLAPYAIPEK